MDYARLEEERAVGGRSQLARQERLLWWTRAAAVGIERNGGVGERLRGGLRGHGGGE